MHFLFGRQPFFIFAREKNCDKNERYISCVHRLRALLRYRSKRTQYSTVLCLLYSTSPFSPRLPPVFFFFNIHHNLFSLCSRNAL